MDVRVGPKGRLNIEELMLSNGGAGEDSGQSSQSLRKSALNIHWKDAEAEPPIIWPPDLKS